MKSKRRENRLSGSTRRKVAAIIANGWAPTHRAENKERAKRILNGIVVCAQWEGRAEQ
jgi:hypothetical protein